MTEAQDSGGLLRIAGVSRTQNALVVRYSLHGEGKAPVWVLDQLFRSSPAGHYHLEPERAYVEARDGVLILSRALRKVPDDVDVESPEVPCVRRLAPAETLTGEIRVPLPLQEDLPYHKGGPLDVAALTSVRVRVGYLVDAPDLRFREAKDDQGRVCRSPRYATAVTRQQFAEVGQLPLPAQANP
ncbi:hypothetical protein [Stigmatella erecta]|uniref:Uncharacterized protein n=1 Tax=Stigmatella erecta TaxID=83460 RepID=A0A1I0F7S2_9BACT|nr:hypothetical protein [Stigmatella erecta]SET53913.1 hypothetical protein SAMN05443639_103293 [Stigmatella erecta]